MVLETMELVTHSSHNIVPVTSYRVSLFYSCLIFAWARSDLPFMILLKSPTGKVTGKSTDSSSWTARRYQTIEVSAKVHAPDA
jgi:hypothetical protein